VQDTKSSHNNEILSAAGRLIDAGISILPQKGKMLAIDSDKLQKLKERSINHHNKDFFFGRADSIAIFLVNNEICIDYEPVFVNSGKYDELLNYVKFIRPEIFDKITIERTKNGGYHWFYRCVQSVGKKVLAKRKPTADETAQGETKILLIEMLGHGQWATCYPSPGYEQVKGDLASLEYLEPEDHAELIAICSFYSELEPEKPPVAKKQQSDPKAVWNVFNEQHDYNWIREQLLEAGFTEVKETESSIALKRPGNTKAKSSGGILKEKNLLYLFSTSTIFPADTPLSPFDVWRYLKYDGDFFQCATALVKEGYGEFHQDQTFEVSFFDIKKTKNGFRVSVNRPRFIELLHANGICLYFPGGNTYVLCKITGCFIEEITTERIKKIVRDHVNSLPEKLDCGISRIELLDFLYRGSDNYFGRGQLEFIDHANVDFLKDTKDTAYLPFKNGVVVITQEKISLLPYSEVKQHIWKDSVIDFDIELNNSSRSGEWYKFYSCICGSDDPEKLTTEQADQFFYLLCLTGYLLHRYKDPSRPFAVILSEKIETDEKGGGTGKGLYFKGLEKIAKACVIPGKNFDPNGTFALQRLKLQDTIIVIDDIPQKFPFESLYNLITEGATREQKNQQQIFLPYEISPKIVLISNYVVSSAGNHAERRQRVFEFSPFFSPRYTPEKHFGHILFNDWDRDEWNRFYNLQIACIMMYLKNGLPQSEKSDTLRRREVVQQFGKEFASWFFDYYTQNGCEDWHPAKELYDGFLQFSELEKTDYTLKRFRAGIASSSRTWGHDLQDRRNKSEGNRTEYRLIKRK
jgi:hypothetical protein